MCAVVVACFDRHSSVLMMTQEELAAELPVVENSRESRLMSSTSGHL